VVLTVVPGTVEVVTNVLVVLLVTVSAGAVIVLSREIVSVEVVTLVVVAVHFGRSASPMCTAWAAFVEEGAVTLRLKMGSTRPDSLYMA
jgi:hypothetical protein